MVKLPRASLFKGSISLCHFLISLCPPSPPTHQKRSVVKSYTPASHFLSTLFNSFLSRLFLFFSLRLGRGVSRGGGSFTQKPSMSLILTSECIIIYTTGGGWTFIAQSTGQPHRSQTSLMPPAAGWNTGLNMASSISTDHRHQHGLCPPPDYRDYSRKLNSENKLFFILDIFLLP